MTITHVRAGAGETLWIAGDTYAFKATGPATSGAFGLIEASIPPGSGPPPHPRQRGRGLLRPRGRPGDHRGRGHRRGADRRLRVPAARRRPPFRQPARGRRPRADPVRPGRAGGLLRPHRPAGAPRRPRAAEWYAGADTMVETEVTYTRHDGGTVTLPAFSTWHTRPDGAIDRYHVSFDPAPIYS